MIRGIVNIGGLAGSINRRDSSTPNIEPWAIAQWPIL